MHLLLLLVLGIFGYAALAQAARAESPQSPEASIQRWIVAPLALPVDSARALLAQAALETGNFASSAFHATNSLFNRHLGNGRIGVPNSDGYWSGEVHYASAADPDLRVYDSLDQSARDMAQLLQEPYYAPALSALKSGDVVRYYSTMELLGFSTQPGYAADLQRTYDQMA